jgi:hypothetical protein
VKRWLSKAIGRVEADTITKEMRWGEERCTVLLYSMRT